MRVRSLFPREEEARAGLRAAQTSGSARISSTAATMLLDRGRVEEACCVARNLGQRGGVRARDRTTAGHRLERRLAEALRTGSGTRARQQFGRDGRARRGTRARASARRAASGPRTPKARAPAPDDASELGERCEQARRGSCAARGAPGRRERVAHVVAGAKHLVVKPEVDRAHAALRQRVALDHRARCVLGDRDDEMALRGSSGRRRPGGRRVRRARRTLGGTRAAGRARS